MWESFIEECQKAKKDKMIFLIGLIIPLIVNLLVGWELSKDVITNIPMAVVDHDQSELSRKMIQYFSDSETFEVRFAENEEQLQNWINRSDVRVGMVIPFHFSREVTTLKSPTVLMLYDGSHMSIASTAKAAASEILLTVKAGAQIKQFESRLGMTGEESYNTAVPINFAYRYLYNPFKSFNNFLTPGFGSAICQTGIGLTGILSILYYNEKKKRKSKYAFYPLGKILFYTLLGTVSLLCSVMIQIYIIGIPFKGSIIKAFLLCLFLALAVSSMTIFVSALVKNRVIGIVVMGILLIPNSIMAGYTWPVLSMPKGYRFIAWWIPFYHFSDNIRDLFLKGSLRNFGGDLRFLFFFSLVMYGMTVLTMVLKDYLKEKEGREDEVLV